MKIKDNPTEKDLIELDDYIRGLRNYLSIAKYKNKYDIMQNIKQAQKIRKKYINHLNQKRK